MQDYQVFFEERKAVVSPEFLSKMKYLTRGDGFYSSDSKEIGQEMKLGLFYDMIESIAKRCYSSIEFLPDSNNEINYDTSYIENLVARFKTLFPNVEDYHQVGDEVRKIDESKLGEIIELSYNLHEEHKRYYLLRDLINAKVDCIENMQYFVDENTISQWNSEYEKAIQTKDTKKMIDMLEYVQNAILREWEKYIGNIQEMNDDNFAFIGHSTNSTKFEKNFMSKYVSTSLLTQDINDTFHSGYGFIFAPKNIVGANGKDMYVNNYVEDQDMLLRYSAIKIINHPRRLIDVCKKQKQENLDNGINKPVYNEVVIDGFEPIGIFCFTDGSKSLNWNEINAKELQESFPNLKIYTFDVMKRKKGADLTQMKLKLINNLQRRKFPNRFDIKEDMLTLYDYFFEEFEKLKQNGNYDETMITALYDKNAKMLSIIDTDPEDLFKGEYSNEQIKYILLKNFKYNIEHIFSGNSKAFVLNDLKKLIPYKEQISSMFEGISEFLDLIDKVEINDEMMEEINKGENINFYTISKCLATKLMESINERELHTQININNFQTQYNQLVLEAQERERIEQQHEFFYSIDLNRGYSSMIKDDYIRTTQDLAEATQEEERINQELEEVSRRLEELEKRKEIVNNSQYENISEHKEIQNAINEIKNNIDFLSKHPLINRKKIKEERKKLHIFETKDRERQHEFEISKIDKNSSIEQEEIILSSKKESLNFDLKYIQSRRKWYEEDLEYIKIKIKEKFKCESIEEIDKAVAMAEQFMQKYDLSNLFYLSKIKDKLNELNSLIYEEQQKYEEIQEEKETISREM